MIKVIYVSGYKSSELGLFKKDDPNITFIKKAIRKELLLFLSEGLEWVMISGQLGVELWAAEVVLDMRERENLEIKLAIVTPFLEQEKNWSESNQEWYASILERADYVASITNRPYDSPAQFRLKNQFAVQKSDGLLLLYDHEKEGSPKYLLQTAKDFQSRSNYEIRYITFYDLQLQIEEEQQRKYEDYQ